VTAALHALDELRKLEGIRSGNLDLQELEKLERSQHQRSAKKRLE
jgi:hypothetical protein